MVRLNVKNLKVECRMKIILVKHYTYHFQPMTEESKATDLNAKI